ncbi:hypothetical protein ARMSODRAFT_548905 [Armillaria solidipes]|uniref:Uncharacterized protein n=1 Tax=Armillaria solidipes TaxID=1076256 RepID=A0A2H3AZR2_9AGAR|nr:hypothetical protein ARMSODRAFT_548905 [Armillaria solidipes]
MFSMALSQSVARPNALEDFCPRRTEWSPARAEQQDVSLFLAQSPPIRRDDWRRNSSDIVQLSADLTPTLFLSLIRRYLIVSSIYDSSMPLLLVSRLSGFIRGWVELLFQRCEQMCPVYERDEMHMSLQLRALRRAAYFCMAAVLNMLALTVPLVLYVGDATWTGNSYVHVCCNYPGPFPAHPFLLDDVMLSENSGS